MLSDYAGDRIRLLILYLVGIDSSQWVAGRNLTSRLYIFHFRERSLSTWGTDGKPLCLPLIDCGYNMFLHISLFTAYESHCSYAAATVSVEVDWPTVRRILYRAHFHMCGHNCYADMKIQFERAPAPGSLTFPST